MKEIERKTDLCSIKSSVFFGQSPLTLHVEHQVAATHKLNHEEQPASGLEARMEAHEERVIRCRLEHVFLGLDPVYILKHKN